jgi:hypothetical protein
MEIGDWAGASRGQSVIVRDDVFVRTVPRPYFNNGLVATHYRLCMCCGCWAISTLAMFRLLVSPLRNTITSGTHASD